MKIRLGVLKRLLAGAVFGLYMGHLLYFLNPQIDVTAPRLLLVTLTYAVICGALAGTFLWLLRIARVRLLGRPDDGEYRPHGFGYVVASAFAAAAIYWAHVYYFRIYLPPGAWRILSKGTTIIAVTAFVLFFIWIFERNATRRMSNLLVTIAFAVIAVSSVLLYQRRDRYREAQTATVVANVSVAEPKPVIVVAIRNLPLDWIITLTGEGSLPFFSRMREEAFVTRLEPFRANSSRSLWASLVTGKLPHRHGVTGRYSYQTPLSGSDRYFIVPSGIGFRAWGLIPPVKRVSAQLPSGDSFPVWQMFERLGFRSAVINWPSTPITTTAAFVATDRFCKTPAAETVRPRSYFPDALKLVEQIKNGQSNVTQLAGRRGDAYRSAIACDSVAARLTDGTRPLTPAVTLIAMTGLAETQSALGLGTNILPSRVTTEGQAIRAYLQAIDSLLNDIDRTRGKATLIIVSPSGPAPPEVPSNVVEGLRSIRMAEAPGSDEGFVVIRDGSTVPQPNPEPAQIVDVVPTILFSAGLPVSRDLDGRVLTNAFREDLLNSQSLSIIQSYEAPRLVVQRVE